MQRRFSLAFVIITAVIALTFGTLAGGVAGGVAALIFNPDSQPVESAADTDEVNPSPDPTSSTTPPLTDQNNSAEPVTVNADASLIADIVEEVSPAVVTVVNEQRLQGNPFDPNDDVQEDPERAGVGSGFFIDEEGYIVTNYHVVDGSDQITVMYANGDEVQATMVGGDEFADVAILQIDGEVPATLTLGDSDALRPGEQVIAIGSALGDYTNTVTEGIVSALGRDLEIRPGFNMEGMIQHSASINPGNSGGPLLNLQGEVVGVNTAVVRSAGLGMTVEGMGFAIPSNTLEQLSTQLIDEGGLERPYMGIVYEPLTGLDSRNEDLPVSNGVIVREVEPNTPADEAGIEAGDIITAVDGQTIDNENPLINELFNYGVGDTVELEVYRPGEDRTLTLELTLAERPDQTDN